MNNITKIVKVALVTLFFCFTTITTQTAVLTDDLEETIIGTVVAVDWDENDEVTAISITVITMVHNPEDEEESEEILEEYLIGDTKEGHELWKHIGETVEVIGIVSTNDDGAKTISVKSYKLIEREPEY